MGFAVVALLTFLGSDTGREPVGALGFGLLGIGNLASWARLRTRRSAWARLEVGATIAGAGTLLYWGFR